jgi:HK97 family phage major capsid protein
MVTSNLEETEYVTADSIKSVVAEAVKASMPSPITAEKIEQIVAAALKNVRQQRSTDIEFPIAHRAGNLSVAQKQLLNVCMKKPQDDGIPESLLNSADQRGLIEEQRMVERFGRKDFTAGGSGTGQELMNFSLSSALLQRLYLGSLLAQRMAAQEVQMPTNPFKLPLTTTRARFYSGVAELTAPTAGAVGTAQPVLTASKLIGMVPFSDEADEDSIIAVLPLLMKQLGDAAAAAYENALINGDTAGTQDSGGSAGDDLRIFDGLRKLILAQAALKKDLSTGGISATNVGALRKLLGKWGTEPSQLVILCGPMAYNDLVLLPETLTAEKAGGRDAARIFTGRAPSLFGIDIVPSEKMLENLNNSGVYDGSTTTQGAIMLIHLPSWIPGARRGFQVEQWRDPRAGANYVIASFRRAFIPIEALTNSKAGAIGYHYAS